jgi:multidrug efflux system membrane fusion protein
VIENMLPDESRSGARDPDSLAPATTQREARDLATEPDATRSRRNRPIKYLIWVLVLAVFAGAFVLILKHKSTPAAAPSRHGAGGSPVATTAATAKSGDIGVYVDAIGTVTPTYTANITSEVTGLVTVVHFTEGQLVRKGTPLIEIDPRPYQATLLQAQGTLERDQNVLAQAQMDLARYRQAWAKNAIPKQTLDDQEKLVLQDQGTVKLDQGAVQYDQVQLSFCHIVSPINGRVGLRLVDPGNVVQANGTTPLAVVTQLQPITVVFSVPEDSLSQIAPQLRNKAKLTVDVLGRADQKQITTGLLLTLDNQIDTTTGTVKARAQFANTDNSLYPNQFVNTRLLVNTEHNATLIPTSAIQHDGTQAFVYVLADNVAHRRAIQQGVADRGNTAVTGINPGDVLATSSFDKLEDGGKVKISKAAPSSTSSGDPGNPASSGSSAP